MAIISPFLERKSEKKIEDELWKITYSNPDRQHYCNACGKRKKHLYEFYHEVLFKDYLRVGEGQLFCCLNCWLNCYGKELVKGHLPTK